MERTPSQTIGPFFHEALRWEDGGSITFSENGSRIVLTGRVLDGAGEPVGDAMIETWQSSPTGKPPAAASGSARPHGFGRVETARDGSYRIETMLPGGDVPCIDVSIYARGLLRALRTRVYLADEQRVRADPLLKPIAGSPRLKTLVAERAPGADGNGARVYRWDIRLQGVGETVFFAF
jgi:protocatechuate 3,4-dioxygenase alpha subunit